MTMTLRTFYAAFLVVWLFATGTAHAGSQADGQIQFEPAKIAALAKKIEREIARRGALIAIISRTGRPPGDLPEGIEYTHVAFAVYSQITTSDGRKLPGYATHNLYQSSTKPNTSFLKQDYLLDYYAAVYALKAGVIIPTPKLQQKLLGVIFSDTYAALHNPDYSAISNPFNVELQNCTEFVLDVVNAAIYDTGDPRRIKANIKAYFEPEPLRVSGFELFLGSLFTADIKLSDHSGPVRTATFGSIARYMEAQGLATELFRVSVE